MRGGYMTKEQHLKIAEMYENVARKSRAHHICPICQQEDKDNQHKDNFDLFPSRSK